MEQAVAGYVRGQVLLSLIIGASAGVGLWVLGTIGWLRARTGTPSCSAPGSRSWS